MKILNLKKGGKYAELAQVYDQNESSLPETVKKKKKFVLFLLPCLLSLQLVAKVSWLRGKSHSLCAGARLNPTVDRT